MKSASIYFKNTINKIILYKKEEVFREIKALPEKGFKHMLLSLETILTNNSVGSAFSKLKIHKKLIDNRQQENTELNNFTSLCEDICEDKIKMYQKNILYRLAEIFISAHNNFEFIKTDNELHNFQLNLSANIDISGIQGLITDNDQL